MNLKAKIISRAAGPKAHLDELTVEILRQDGTRFPSSVTIKVPVQKGASPEEITGAIRSALRGKVTVGHLTGEVFDL